VADKAIIYIKKYDEPLIPVTTRIEWLPDGKIKPLMYWTPDGSCYEIRPEYEMTPLAFLEDRAEGLRYKIKSEVIETPEPYSDHRLTQHETYLYFADNWFCGRNFIDERYSHKGKEYVSVTLDIFPNCNYELVYFQVKGTRYAVEKTIAVEPRGSFYAGGVGIWHKVKARQINPDNDEDINPGKSIRRMAALFFEVNKWFVPVKPHESGVRTAVLRQKRAPVN